MTNSLSLKKEFIDKCRENSIPVKDVVFVTSRILMCRVMQNLKSPITCEVNVNFGSFEIKNSDIHVATVRR